VKTKFLKNRTNSKIGAKWNSALFLNFFNRILLGACILFLVGCRRAPNPSEQLSALTAQEVAKRKLTDLGKPLKPIMVIAGSVDIWRTQGGELEHTVPSWVFVSSDESNPLGSISVEVRVKSEGRGMLKIKSRISDINFPPESAKHLAIITNWVLDIKAAQTILKRAGARTREGTFVLQMRNVDGELAPVWTLPLNMPSALSSGVRADSGVIVYLEDDKIDKWTRDNGSQLN
jgi:hypothetical protein